MPAAHITRTELTPDIDNNALIVKVHGSSAAEGSPVSAEVSVSGKELAKGRGKVGEAFTIQIPEPRLWTPDTPFLYDLELSLVSKSEPTAEAAVNTVSFSLAAILSS